MDKISINNFQEYIMYRQPARLKSDKGQVKEIWTDYRKALVEIVQTNNDERKEGDRINLPGTLIINAHYDSGINTTFRVVYGTDIYNITSITPVQNRLFMVVRADKVFD